MLKPNNYSETLNQIQKEMEAGIQSRHLVQVALVIDLGLHRQLIVDEVCNPDLHWGQEGGERHGPQKCRAGASHARVGIRIRCYCLWDISVT